MKGWTELMVALFLITPSPHGLAKNGVHQVCLKGRIGFLFLFLQTLLPLAGGWNLLRSHPYFYCSAVKFFVSLGYPCV